MNVFDDLVLPMLLEMSENPLQPYPLQRRIRELGVENEDERTRLIDLLKDSRLITMGGSKNGAGVWYVVIDVFITPKGLAQLTLWPSDNERALFLLEKVADALDAVANDVEVSGDVEQAGRVQSAARGFRSVMREVSTEIAAKVISNVVVGG